MDFLLDIGANLSLADAKWTEFPDKKSIEGLEYAAQKLKSVKRQSIICRTPNSFSLGDKVEATNLESLNYFLSHK